MVDTLVFENANEMRDACMMEFPLGFHMLDVLCAMIPCQRPFP